MLLLSMITHATNIELNCLGTPEHYAEIDASISSGQSSNDWPSPAISNEERRTRLITIFVDLSIKMRTGSHNKLQLSEISTHQYPFNPPTPSAFSAVHLRQRCSIDELDRSIRLQRRNGSNIIHRPLHLIQDRHQDRSTSWSRVASIAFRTFRKLGYD